MSLKTWWIVMAAAAFVAAGLAPSLLSPYNLRILILALITAIAVVGLCFTFGFAGLLQFAQGAFVGLGAYTSSYLTTTLGLSFWLALPLSLAVGAIAGAMLGFPILRLRGHYLALATLGLNVTLLIVAKNWASVTGGDDGLGGIPPVALGTFALDTDASFYYFALAALIVAMLVGYAIKSSHLGRAMIAVRDDELASGACGVGVLRTKLVAFTLGTVYAALSGALYAHYSNYISPGDFDTVRSITLLVMLIVGGESSIWGAVVGAILISFAPEWLRFVGQGYLTAFGIGVILVLILLPGGVAGRVASMKRLRVS